MARVKLSVIPDQPYYSYDEACYYLKLSALNLDRLIKKGNYYAVEVKYMIGSFYCREVFVQLMRDKYLSKL
ncbi:hypothetical protein DAETH_10070 [Deinococcus aetherius]|uniref:Helix-turn-helix domain-containing protein n=1 Tax=Deinococcus aetherius TaxID=200252 RepID=A0ABM8ABB1_9DEIO|nr:hypothetical protein DAETH_10070 [Deinococcus aetherius]